jgi:hypothetical protein
MEEPAKIKIVKEMLIAKRAAPELIKDPISNHFHYLKRYIR